MSSSRCNLILLAFAMVSWAPQRVASDCLADPTLNADFEALVGAPIPTEGSCCMLDVCGLPCPAPVPDPSSGFGIAVAIFIGISFVIGMATYFVVKGDAENYFVAGKSLPLWIVATTLGAQAVDVNSLLTNADLSYKFHFFDGAAIPIGICGSLVLNAIFLAKHINAETGLTLPDVLSKRYGKTVEVFVSMTTITSFLMLLAGNLVGLGTITSYVWGIELEPAIWLAAVIVWAYTVSGGLFSVAYTDVVQGAIGWTGCVVMAYWFIFKAEQQAPPPSIGFPGYVYPDDTICQLYDGVNCTVDASLCCYNAEKWCPENGDTCRTDNGAYPIGDQRVFGNQMFDPYALAPFPNAIWWNWCTIVILAVGNLGALDFQVRVIAAKTPRDAQLGCWIGGLFCLFIGIPFSYLGSITRFHYGPDSIHAEFAADTCSTLLGLPTCGAWVPDPNAFIHLLTQEAPPFLGAWCLVGIVAASMSTADGAILAMGTVFSHNMVRQLDGWFPNLVTSENLLLMARLSTIPLALISTMIAAYYKNSSSSAGATGYLLIVAFDIVLATTVAPIFGVFYTKNPSPRAALCSVLVGTIIRVTLEFTLPKDGFLLLPFDSPEFLDYGSAASSLFPPFFDVDAADMWDPEVEPCEQVLFEDYTGVDSMAAFIGSVLAFVIVQTVENSMGGKPLFSFPGMEPYEKECQKPKPLDDTVKNGKEFLDETSDASMPGEAAEESFA